MAKAKRSHRDLDVFNTALDAALFAAKLTRKWPKDEFALKDQTRRCGRSPGAAIAEAWRKRNYLPFWKNKLSDAQAEAGEAQWWVEVAYCEGYCTREEFELALDKFEKLIAQLTLMIVNPKPWVTDPRV